jgi:hypothetical protein
LPHAEPTEPADPGRPNPFAALAKLKRGAGGGMTDG